MSDKHFNKIYYSVIDELKNEEALFRAYNLLPQFRKDKVDKYKNKNDKLLSIGVWVLLNKALEINGYDINNFEVCYEDNGKPYLKDCPLNFSLSHSGKVILVGISTTPIGVDVQEKRELSTDIKPILFNNDDKKYFDLVKDKIDAFYTIWSLKESYLKMIGKGITTKLASIKINYQNKKIESSKMYINDSINNYKICACVSNSRSVSFKNISIL